MTITEKLVVRQKAYSRRKKIIKTMSKYQIVKNDIIISTNKTGAELYNSTKNLIDKYSNDIKTNIQLILISQKLITEISTIDIDCKNQFVNFQKKQIEFYRLYGYFLNFNIDFSISSRELYISSNKSEMHYYLKNIYVELYRFLERHNNEMGIIRELSGKSKEYKEYNKSLTDFRSNYYNKIKKYRHNLFAHYEKDTNYEEFYKSLNEINAEEVAIMCLVFFSLQENLSKILKNISDNLAHESAINNELINKAKDRYYTQKKN